MIWLRRGLAVLLVSIFVGVFVAAVVVTHVSGFLFSADFYARELRKAYAYAWLYDEALPGAFREFFNGYAATGFDRAQAEDEAIAAARQVFPPDWLQAQVEALLSAALPYLAGDTSDFSVAVPLAEKVEAAGQEAKRLLKGGPTVDLFYEKLTADLAERALESLHDRPVGLKLTQADIANALRTAVPKEWLAAQGGRVVDQVAPYLVGRSEHFAITLPLKERADAASQALKDLARRSGAPSVVLEGVVDTLLNETVGATTGLSYGITLTREEARAALRQVLPPNWVEARLNELIDALVAYLTGKTETLRLSVPLVDRREAAFQVLVALADRKLEAAVSALPQCSLQQFTSSLPGPGELPACRPTGMDYPRVRQLLGADLERLVRQAFVVQIPEAWTFGESQLRIMLGADAWDGLQSARRWVAQGFTYTDTDLRADLGKDNERALDSLRKYTRQGAVFTGADLREELGKTRRGQRFLENLEAARGLLWLAWPVPLVLLLAIGMLGGRTWGSRLAWAGGTLALAAIALLIVAGPVYSADEVWVGQAADAALRSGIWRPLVDRVALVAQNAASEVVGGLRVRALVSLAIGILALSAGVALHQHASARRGA